jgi:hypothetical protein
MQRFSGFRRIERIDSGTLTSTAIAAAPFTVPVGQLWLVSAVVVRLATSATVGNRGVRLEMRDASDAPYYGSQGVPATGQAASTTHYHIWADGATRDAAVFGNTQGFIQAVQPFPSGISMRAGEDMFIRDSANVDGAGDSFRVQLIVERLYT